MRHGLPAGETVRADFRLDCCKTVPFSTHHPFCLLAPLSPLPDPQRRQRLAPRKDCPSSLLTPQLKATHQANCIHSPPHQPLFRLDYRHEALAHIPRRLCCTNTTLYRCRSLYVPLDDLPLLGYQRLTLLSHSLLLHHEALDWRSMDPRRSPCSQLETCGRRH